MLPLYHHLKMNKKSLITLQSNLGRATLPPVTQRMDSAACTANCAMPTADESTQLLLQYYLCKINWTNLPYLSVITNEHAMMQAATC